MKKLPIHYIVCLLLGLYATTTHGQSLQTSQLYASNPFSLHAAYAGTGEGIFAAVQGWNRWNGLGSSAPVGGLLAIHGQLDEKLGLGGRVLSDRRGAFNSFIFDASASYLVPLKEKVSLRLAVNAGMIQSRIAEGGAVNEFVNLNDPLLQNFQETNLQVGTSALFTWNALQVAASLPNLLAQGNQLYNRPVLLTAMYQIAASERMDVMPIVAYQSLKNHPSLLDAGARVTWQKEFWGQVMYRSSGSAILGGGISLGNLQVGYMYETATGQFSHASNGSHEIFLGVRFGKKTAAPVEYLKQPLVNSSPK